MKIRMISGNWRHGSDKRTMRIGMPHGSYVHRPGATPIFHLTRRRRMVDFTAYHDRPNNL
ncbi:hypothetical protein NJLHNGOC_05545 [Novacetimonas cocois]|uniref:Uncharacterized protein n=1 Tax=Novacetimonas cocois TaxID=1747507 RepID=A0A365YXE3_9PROT|nr:hypothetical protein NJLHNGOC_05545 [Novacetimonas cocois]